MSPPCYVFFDVDDTLIEWTVSWPDAFTHAAREVGVAVSPEESLAALKTALSTGLYTDLVHRHADDEDDRAFWLAYDGRLLEILGVKQGLRQATERIVATLTHPDSRRLYADVPDVLRSLSHNGAKLGIVTGRPRAAPELEALGVRSYFHPVIDAFAARSGKDEGHMFHLAAEAAAKYDAPAWHVGDNYDLDVLGARAAGLRPVLLDRTGAHEEVDCPRIESLGELPPLLLETTG